MSDVWFRGEAVGVGPASVGGAVHDLGEGMYLTDSEEVAKEYSRLRSSDASKQRVYSVTVDRSSLRVLDLTTDARWAKHVQPVEKLLKMGTANENYGRTFESFIKTHKIDLTKYDVVIGHEYVRGGKQMCVLNKNGQPTKLHASIRSRFKSLTQPTVRVRPPIPTINVKTRGVSFRSRGGSFVRGAAGSIGGFVITLALGLLRRWLDKKMIEEKLQERLAALPPQIDAKIDGLKADIIKVQLLSDKGGKTFANIKIEVHFVTKSLGVRLGDYIDPEVYLTDINITSRDETSYRTSKQKHRDIHEYVNSVEVGVFTEEELDVFRDLSTEYLEYSRKLMLDAYNPILIEEIRKLRALIVQTYGNDIWYLKIEETAGR